MKRSIGDAIRSVLVWCGDRPHSCGVLRFTVFGRHLFALGSNEATARLCGVNVVGTRIAVYTLSGFFVALAGLYQFSRLSSGNPTSEAGWNCALSPRSSLVAGVCPAVVGPSWERWRVRR